MVLSFIMLQPRFVTNLSTLYLKDRLDPNKGFVLIISHLSNLTTFSCQLLCWRDGDEEDENGDDDDDDNDENGDLWEKGWLWVGKDSWLSGKPGLMMEYLKRSSAKLQKRSRRAPGTLCLCCSQFLILRAI